MELRRLAGVCDASSFLGTTATGRGGEFGVAALVTVGGARSAKKYDAGDDSVLKADTAGASVGNIVSVRANQLPILGNRYLRKRLSQLLQYFCCLHPDLHGFQCL